MLNEQQNLEVKDAMETAFRQMENNYNTEMDMDARNILFEEIDLITDKESVPLDGLVSKGVPQPGAVAEIGTLDELLNNIGNEEFVIDQDFTKEETRKYKAGMFWVARRIIERIKELDANHEHEFYAYEYFDEY